MTGDFSYNKIWIIENAVQILLMNLNYGKRGADSVNESGI